MGWRIVYISNCNKMSVKLNNLVLKREDEVLTIPIRDIDTLLIEDMKTVVTLPLLNVLSEYKVNVILCNDKHDPTLLLQPIHGFCRQRKSIENQFYWTETIKGELWKKIIRNKISNQRRVLEYALCDAKDIQQMKEYETFVDLGDTKNIEAKAARLYFLALFGTSFSRGDNNAINAALNYGYTIVLSCFNRILSCKGVLLCYGIHHKNEYNSFNLACDFMEPFRPFIDLWVYKYIRKTFDSNDKISIVNLLYQKTVIHQRNERLSNAIELYCDCLCKCLNEDCISLDINEYFPNVECFYEV